MQKMDVFELADLPMDGKLIGVQWVYKLKLDAQWRATQYKARLVAQGYAQRPGLDYDQTFSPVVCLQTMHILLALAHRYRLHIAQLDMSTAFLNGNIDKEVHIQIPPTFETPENNGKCYCLKKALYGLKQAGRLWHAVLDEQLKAFSFKRCCVEPCVYVQGIKDAMIILAVYVDDLLVIGVMSSRVKSVRQQLSSVFSITDQGNISQIIGMNVKYDCEAQMLSIDQSGYIEGTLEKFGMSDAWAVQSPAIEAINAMGPWQGDIASVEEIRHYTSLIGSLLWNAQGTRPDIAFAVSQCTRFVANPSSEHLIATKRILKYLKGTIDISLNIHLQLVLTTSTNSGKQLDQSLPKTSAIHVAAGTTALNLHEGSLTFNPTTPILYSDSAGARVIANDPQHFKRTKHINITHFFLRDEVADGCLTIAPVQSSENLTEILTKPLTAPTLLHLRKLFGLTVLKRHAGSRGGAKEDDPA
ncbi:uncharacterized protein UHOD_11870 [Ustilago sp. UG-2017b]|nr:uncharacterized protein UHOD_11870 [Ustilago sp. UG-2017b]